MGLSTAERNRRKRERRKREREQQQQGAELPFGSPNNDKRNDEDNEQEGEEIEVEYVAEPLRLPEDDQNFAEVVKAQRRAVAGIVGVVVSSDEDDNADIRNKDGDHRGGKDAGRMSEQEDVGDEDDDEEDGEDGRRRGALSKRKLREILRPTVAELKRRVKRPDLVEAHDVTAPDPDFLIELKSVEGTVPVPRHWGRKRKYLQGKRGFEKPPFQLPDFIVRTGIAEVRDAAAQQDSEMSAKQRNRMRVAPKMGAIDVDYKVLYDAFFKHQTKPTNLTKFGELYYEGKELEMKLNNVKPGWPYSNRLREALGMVGPTAPPPFLVNMQRYGPPPSYPGLKIPGLNAPLPAPECQYGYHPGGWGKPPIDPYGRPLYGGNPFDPPGTFGLESPLQSGDVTLVTSDGKTLGKSDWGALPTKAAGEDDFGGEEESEEESGSEMEESEEEEEGQVEDEEGIGMGAADASGIESVLPSLPLAGATAPKDLRKLGAGGDETPVPTLYRVLEQTRPATLSAQLQAGAVFASEVGYVVPGANLPEGAESVLSKAPGEVSKPAKVKDNDDEDDADRNFKF